MQGLKTQESEKFRRFWNIVQKTASNQGKRFFLECGEGREFSNEEMEGEDVRGWLIPTNEIDEFKPEWEADNVTDKWIYNIFRAEWSDTNGNITVEFKTY